MAVLLISLNIFFRKVDFQVMTGWAGHVNP